MRRHRDRSSPFIRLVGAAALAVVMLAGALLVDGISQRAEATIVLQLDTEAMSARADSIFLGRVEALRSVRKNGRIITEVDLHVALPIKGRDDTGEIITVHRPGGRTGDLAQIVPGAPDFSVGEEVLMFLDRSREGQAPLVMGMAQGKFHVVEGPDRALWVVRDLSELTFAAIETLPDGSRQVAIIEEAAIKDEGAVPLSAMVQKIAASLRRHGMKIRPELTQRLGPELNRQHDFSIELRQLGPLPELQSDGREVK